MCCDQTQKHWLTIWQKKHDQFRNQLDQFIITEDTRLLYYRDSTLLQFENTQSSERLITVLYPVWIQIKLCAELNNNYFIIRVS